MTFARLLRLFYFGMAVAVFIIVLKILNWLPTVIQTDTVREYSSIEEVKTKLNIKDIYMPSYFPQNLKWPPAKIIAQKRPFTAVIMEFKSLEKGDVTLVISQTDSEINFIPSNKIKMYRSRENVSYFLKGRHVVMDVGVCKNNEPCSQISWKEGRYKINVALKSPPFELIRIVESMFP